MVESVTDTVDLAQQWDRVKTKLSEGYEWPSHLFPKCDLYDFNASDYVEFLNLVNSKDSLIEGLEALSPFADDALQVARKFTEDDFEIFKKAQKHERQIKNSGAESIMPNRWTPILLPAKFIDAMLVAEQFEAPLGTTLIRLLEISMENKNQEES